MFGLWIVFLIINPVQVCSQELRKCCPQGSSLYAGRQVACLHSSHAWVNETFSIGIPEGCVVSSSEDCDIADEGTVASCIDNLNGTESVVSIRCPNDTSKFTVPSVHYFHKCCPVQRIYDSKLRSCWGRQKNVWPTEFLRRLMGNFSGIIDIRHGPPLCASSQVVVDRLLKLDRVRREQSASISFQDGDLKYVLNPDEVCVDQTEVKEILVVRTCEEERTACQKSTCIRKCCPEGQSYFRSTKCVDSWKSIKPMTVYNISDSGYVTKVIRSVVYTHGINCKKYKENFTQTFKLSFDGSIYNSGNNEWTDSGKFCIENVVSLKDNRGRDFVFFCYKQSEPEVHVWTNIAMWISSFFLLLTITVYGLLPFLRNIVGKVLMCHNTCLMVAYISLCTAQLFTIQIGDRECLVLGYITLFSFLSAFFWLNIISFDIWWTFGSMRPIVNRKKREWRKFLMYSAYAWINPTIITTLAGLTDHLGLLPNSLRPGIGDTSCWFDTSKNGLFLFFTGPVGVLLTINLVFFILTARHCAKVKSDLDKVGHTPIADNKFKSDRTRLVMNCKLFVAMGINWGLEFLSAVAHRISFIPIEVWYLSDMANACQGLVIFCIFVMKRRILLELRRRMEELLCCIKPAPRQPSVSTLFSGNNTTTSTDTGIHPTMKKCVSETRLSPLPPIKHQFNLKNQKKSKSTNRLLA